MFSNKRRRHRSVNKNNKSLYDEKLHSTSTDIMGALLEVDHVISTCLSDFFHRMFKYKYNTQNSISVYDCRMRKKKIYFINV
jgi:hypothetical protein